MRNIIETRQTRLVDQGTESGRRSWIQRRLIQYGLPPVRDWDWRGPPVAARVDYGRWIADCPRCTGAEFVDPGWPLFVCCSCGSGPHSVTFPSPREEIEGELLKRPDGATRNWRPGESVADLRRENREGGTD